MGNPPYKGEAGRYRVILFFGGRSPDVRLQVSCGLSCLISSPEWGSTDHSSLFWVPSEQGSLQESSSQASSDRPPKLCPGGPIQSRLSGLFSAESKPASRRIREALFVGAWKWGMGSTASSTSFQPDLCSQPHPETCVVPSAP